MTRPGRGLAAVVAGLVIGLTAPTPVSIAQAPPKLVLIAILEQGPAARPSAVLATMKEALAELGWVQGRTARFEIRYADWQPDRLAELARELVRLKPDVVYTHSTACPPTRRFKHSMAEPPRRAAPAVRGA
jgi:putative ABC transport system substrate-binding protein